MANGHIGFPFSPFSFFPPYTLRPCRVGGSVSWKSTDECTRRDFDLLVVLLLLEEVRQYNCRTNRKPGSYLLVAP